MSQPFKSPPAEDPTGHGSATDPARHRPAWWRRDFRRFIDCARRFL